MDARTQQIMSLALQGNWNQVGRLASNFRREASFQKGKTKTATTLQGEILLDSPEREESPPE